MREKNKFLYVFIVVMFVTFIPQVNYGAVSAHVIYEVDWLSDNSAKVTLKWNDDQVATPIRITSWTVNEDQSVTLRYYQGTNVVEGFNKRTITDSKLEAPCVFILEEDLGPNSITEAVFPDLPSNQEGSTSIKHLYYLGIINGYPTGEFKPSGQVSRAEFSKMLFLSGEMSISLDSPITFTDLTVGHWAEDYIYTLASREIVKGIGNNQFNPNGTITIGEVATIIDRSFTLFGEASSYPYSLDNHWSNEYFLSLVDKGIMKTTDDYFYPYSPKKIATREDCAILLSRVLLNYHEVND